MAKYKNKTIYVNGRYFDVLDINEYLEIFYVREMDRNFRTIIKFEEVE